MRSRADIQNRVTGDCHLMAKSLESASVLSFCASYRIDLQPA